MLNCARCGGKGSITCPKCGGETVVKEQQLESVLIMGRSRTPYECPECRGTGTISCPDCSASGEVDDDDD
jgi:DnaJ-class molecular chaperone